VALRDNLIASNIASGNKSRLQLWLGHHEIPQKIEHCTNWVQNSTKKRESADGYCYSQNYLTVPPK